MGGLLTGLQGLGQSNAVGNFINTAGQYQAQQNQGAYLQAHGAYMQQHANVLQVQTEEAKKQQDFMAQRVDFKLSPFYLSLPEESRPDAEKMFRGYGAIDANGFGTRGDMYKTMDTIGKTKNEFGPLMQPVIDAKTQLAQKAYEKYQKALASGDEVGAKQAQSDFNIARANAEASKGTFLDHMSKLDLVNARYGASKGGVLDKVLVDPDNGERYTRMKDGSLLDGQGNDVSQEIDTSGLIPEGQQREPKAPTSPDSIFMEADSIIRDPSSTPDQISKAKADQVAVIKLKEAAGEGRFAGLHGETMIGTTTEGFPVYKDTRKAGEPAFTFNADGSKKTYSGVIAQKSEALPLSGGAPAEKSATYKADRASLAKLTVGADSIMAFKKGVSVSLDLVDKLQDKFSRTGIPGINKLSQWIQYNAGDPDVKAFRNATTTAMTEYMKVTTAGMGLSAQELTQMAQARAKTLLDIVDNPMTFKKSINVMHQEMDIKERAFKAQRAEIQQRLGGGASDVTGGNQSDPYGIR